MSVRPFAILVTGDAGLRIVSSALPAHAPRHATPHRDPQTALPLGPAFYEVRLPPKVRPPASTGLARKRTSMRGLACFGGSDKEMPTFFP